MAKNCPKNLLKKMSKLPKMAVIGLVLDSGLAQGSGSDFGPGYPGPGLVAGRTSSEIFNRFSLIFEC